MTTHLLVIDPQNDFCDIAQAALPVAGADADLQRLADFVQRHQAHLDGITVTLDSHASVAVERVSFWTDAHGEPLAPFTFVTGDDVRSGKYLPRDQSLTPAVLTMLEQLAKAGRPGLVVWPVHCVTGTWGHNIHRGLARQLQAWEIGHQRAVRKVLKGEYPLTEHFGVFEADAPVASVASTQFNTALARSLTEGVDLLLLAGEASSHCVAASFDQLARYLQQQPGTGPELVLLSDCMSPVSGFESVANDFLDRARNLGARILSTSQAAELLV
jgi:nicotinamidase-related amidase